MPTGVRGTSDFYKERYGLSERVAVRLAALLASQVELTAAVIECLADSAALRHVVLHPELLKLAGKLDTALVRSLVQPGEALPVPLVVVERGGWRLVALEEELLAEGAEDEDGELHLPALAPKAEVLHPGEIAELFTRRDIAELELTLRTSAEPKEKITAIRRLALSPASQREKIALFAMALTDRDALVRSEAAQALTSLGLAPEVAEDARTLAEGNDRQKQFAAQRIGSRFGEATQAEIGVLLRLVAGTLRYEPSLEVRRLLIRAVEGACRAVARDADSTRDLVRMLVAQLRDAAEELGPHVHRVLSILGQERPGDVYAFLQDELAAIADPAIRRLLLIVAGDVAAAEPQHEQVCSQVIDEILASTDPAVECLQLSNVPTRMGEAAVAAIADRLLDAPEAAQEALVRILDVIATRPEATRTARAKVGRLFLAILQRGQRAARLAVINSMAPGDPAVPPATRRDMAAELLACVQEYANPGIVAAIEATVAKLGAPALEPILDVLANGQRERPRVSAAHVLGALVPRLDAADAEPARAAILAALGLLASPFPDRATLARMTAQACTGPTAADATVARVAEVLRAAVLEREVSNAALDGLGRLCLSPKAAPTLKVDLLDFFTRLLGRQLPEIEARSLTKNDEIVYDLGSEVAAYTELVPGIIVGLRNIATTSGGRVRDGALDRLLDTWRRITEGELQLGPRNTEILLDALRTIGTLDDAEPPQREAIADAVALRRDYLPIYPVLADLVAAAGDAMTDRAAALADELLAREAGDRHLTESDRGLLLDALVRLATRAALGARRARLQELIVAAVLDSDSREFEGALPLLETLHESPALPARLSKRIASRLAAHPRT